MILKIYIENKLLDLFDDENIELNSSVANVEDISKVNTDYTKTFTVPASDNNNAIFRHYYNADIDNTFDARTKKDARIEIDGYPFRTGKMRLEKVIVSKGRASSYTINFWGNLVNFKTLIKDDLLSDLDLSQYNHVYNYPNVVIGLTSGMFEKDIIYTLMSQNRQYMYNSDPGDNTNTDKLVNIAYNGQNRGIVWNELKPSIRLLSIIKAIESKYGITFSRDFFGRNEFKELYMWLNKTDEANYTEQKIDFTGGSATQWGLNLSTDQWQLNGLPNNVYYIRYRVNVFPKPGYENVPYKIIARNNNVQVLQQDATGAAATDFVEHDSFPINYSFYVSSAASFEYTAQLTLQGITTFGTQERYGTTGDLAITDFFDITESLPELKTIDFLKGIFNMFKLVAIPDNMNNVYVNNIDDYYREGNVYDITKWVDADKYDVERGKIFNRISFKYQEPTTILNMQFKKNTGLSYGDEVLELADSDGVPLDGDELEIKIPFEQVVFERLIDINNNDRSKIQYGLVMDDKLEPANPKAVIYYNNPVSIALFPISILSSNGTANQIATTINTPGHSLTLDSPENTVLWGVEFSTWNAAAMENTLYKKYWSSYISSIFNVKKRNFKFKAILPVWLLTKLSLNDVLFIKDRYYRINDFTVSLIKREATLNLMNTFENNFGLFQPSQNRVLLNALPQVYGVYVTNGSVMNITKEDLGAGTDWAIVSKSGFNLNIEVTENDSETERSIFITVNNGSGKSFQIFLNQEG